MTKRGRLLTNSPVPLVLQTNAACLRICFDVCAQSLTAVKSTDPILLFFHGIPRSTGMCFALYFEDVFPSCRVSDDVCSADIADQCWWEEHLHR